MDALGNPDNGSSTRFAHVGGTTAVHISRRGSVRISNIESVPSDEHCDTVKEQGKQFDGSHPSANNIEAQHAFKERYAILKDIYEQRIESLAARVDEALYRMQADPIRSAMAADPLTAPFSASRAREIATESLNREREGFIIGLSEQLAKVQSTLASHVTTSKAVHAELSRHIARAGVELRELQEQNADTTAALDAERVAHTECRGELEATRAKLAMMEQTRADEKDEMRVAVDRLKGMVQQAGSNDAKVASANRLVSTLESKVQEQMAQLSELEKHHALQMEQEQKRSAASVQDAQARALRMGTELAEARRRAEQDGAKLADVTARYDELKRDHIEMERSSEQIRNLLERSETERLELRQQYMALGDKLEAALNADSRGTAREVARLKDKVKRSKEKYAAAVSAHKEKSSAKKEQIAQLEADILAVKEDLHAKNMSVQSAEQRCAALESEIETSRAHREASMERATSRIADLESELRDTRETEMELRDELRKARNKTASAVNAARDECRKLMDEQRRTHALEMDEADKARRSLEAERWREQRQNEERMHMQYSSSSIPS